MLIKSRSSLLSLSLSRWTRPAPSIKGIIKERSPLSWEGAVTAETWYETETSISLQRAHVRTGDCTTPTSYAKMLWFSVVDPRGVERVADGRSKRESRRFVALARFMERTTTWRAACGRLERLACCEIVYRRGATMNLSMVAQVLQARYRHALRVNPVATGLGYRLQGRKDRDRKKGNYRVGATVATRTPPWEGRAADD